MVTNIQGVADKMRNKEFISPFSYNQFSYTHIYFRLRCNLIFPLLLPFAIYFCRTRPSHQVAVYLAKTVTLYFPLYLK
jgi:hypothetical protein